MKKLFKLLIFTLLIFVARPTLAAVSSSPVQQQAIVSSGATVSITMSGTPVSGNTLILFIGSQAADKAITINSISETGVTWQVAQTSNTNRRSLIWYGNVGSSPSASITVTLSGTPGTTMRGGISEWSGLLSTAALDASASNNGSSAAPTTGTITPTAGRNALIIATSANPGNASLPTNSFTALTSQDPSFPGSYLVVPGLSGSYNTAWTSSSSGAWDTEIATFLAPPPVYTYSRSITVDHTKVGSVDSTNFPVLVSGTYSYLATVANGGLVQNSSGFDVGFYTSSACTTKLNWETRTYTAASGLVTYWVQVPTVSHTTDTVFYECYGSSSISTDQSNMTGTWRSDFKRVFHVDNGTTLDGTDSTGVGSLTNSGASASAVKVNGGVSFNGSTSMSGVNTSMPSPTGAWTYAFWWNADAQVSVIGRLLSFYNGTQSLQIGRVDNGAYIATGTGAGDVAPKQSLESTDPAGLEYVVFTFDGVSTYHTYVNSTDVSANLYPRSDLTLFTGNTTTVYLGQRGNGSNINALNDEVFVLNTAASSSEITGWYNSTNSPSTFYTVGTQSGGGVASSITGITSMTGVFSITF